MIFRLKTVILTHVIYFSHCGPLDVQKKSHIILPQSGDPFNSFTGNFAAEESFIEQVHVVTPANFITPSSAKFVTPSSGKQSIFSKKSVTTTTIKSSTTTSTSTTSKPSEKEEFLNDQADTEDVIIDTDVNRIKDTSHWETLTSFNLSDGLSVSKYRSKLTGLTVVLAKAESPIVNGYFCLATEAMDNDGLPHTLEHLIFLGSEDYPYKEVLDLLANRALADRTNAWTDTDHTCYTVYTAGPSGFLHILPVYLDHILYPNLREEDYITEVHHINGEGQDAGVVYSEMQGVEQSTSNIMYFSLAKKLYPESGYYAETGGYLRNLRESTNIEKVRAYHKKFYRPENLVLTITGKMDEQDLFETLRKTEEKVLRKRHVQGCDDFIRPWQTPLKKLNLKEDLIYEIDYPSEDETLGSIAVAWRLNETISENIEMLEAYNLILKYLTSKQVSPLEIAFVENNDPLATSVSSDTLEVKIPSILVEFENVPVERIDEVIPKMDNVLKKIVDDGPEKFDLERITNFIHLEVINNLKDIENSPHLFVPDASVLDMLYSESNQDLEKFVRSSQSNKKFMDKDSTFWIELIREQFLNRPKIVLKGKPSKSEARDLAEKEEARLKKQIEELGTKGLEEKEEILENAIESQKLPGEEVLQKIPLGTVESIEFRTVETYNRTMNRKNLINFNNIPFKIQVQDVMSNFVQMYLFISTEKLNPREKDLLPILLDVWMSSPQIKNGKVIDIETVIKRQTKTLLYTDYFLGLSGSTFSPGAYADTIIIEAQCEMKKFDEAIKFISDVINYPHFTDVKVNTTAANLLNNIPSLKLSATDVLRVLHDGIYFNSNNNIHHTNFVRQTKVLEDVIDSIKAEPKKIVRELSDIKKKLAMPENVFFFLATNVKDLVKQEGADLSTLRNLINSDSQQTRQELSQRFIVKSEHFYRDSNKTRPQHVAFGVGGTESCYMKQSVYYDNTDWTKPSAAAERVMLQYLSDRMYDEVRGQGLTYGVSMAVSITEGRATLSLTRSSRVAEAYEAVREILKRYVDNEDEWDKSLLASAKGSLIYSWTEKEETVEDLMGQTVKAYMRQTDTKYNRDFVRALGRVTLSDVRAAALQILPSFLSADTSQTVIVCPPTNIKDVAEEFGETGLQLTEFTNLDQTFLFE